MTSSHGPSLTLPDWPHCAEGADPAMDPIGCSGIRFAGHTRCLEHLTATDRTAFLASLSPGDAHSRC
ncbi:hypothetical protein [Streptomyces sp. NPDC005953]|uniref:hypothetical protein n=1 Tax=Streptomyces sp. NPDC005953 TaxID=3156719 RepID=UPI0033D21A2E